MSILLRIVLGALLLCFYQFSASACFPQWRDLRQVPMADLVVVGSIERVELITTELDRERVDRLNVNHKLSSDSAFASYAKIHIRVSRTLLGAADRNITAELWSVGAYKKSYDNRSRLFVLINADKARPYRWKNINKTGEAPPEKPNSLALMGGGCMSYYMFLEGEEAGRAIKQIFDGEGDPKIKASILAKFINMDGSGRF